jgi:hypothetical protein
MLDTLDSSVKKALMKRTKAPLTTQLLLPTLPEVQYQEPKHVEPEILKTPRPSKPLEDKTPPKYVPQEVEDVADEVKSDSTDAEEGLLAQLESANADVQLRGFYSLLNLVQEYTLLGVQEPLVLEDGVNVVKKRLLNMYGTASGELLLSMLDPDYVQILVEGGILSIDELFLPMLSISVTPKQSNQILDHTQVFLDNFKGSKTVLELLTGAFHALTPKHRIGLRLKKTPEARIIEAKVFEAISSLVNNTLSIQDNVDEASQFFDVDLNVRQALHTLAPQLMLKSTTERTKRDVFDILSVVHSVQPQLFMKTIETLDYEVSGMIKKELKIEEEFNGSEPCSEISRVFSEDLTFDDVLNVDYLLT